MNIESAVMSVPYGEAYGQFQAYRRLVKDTPKRATKDDVSLYRALWQITRGQKVIDLNTAIGRAGLDANSRPRLAVARADWTSVVCSSTGDFVQFSTKSAVWGRRAAGDCRVPGMAFGLVNANRVQMGRAQVPMIPAKHRPDAALSNYHILFEAEWGNVSPDPLLLRYIDGPFYVVLAQWDLTPLEQAVLRQRL